MIVFDGQEIVINYHEGSSDYIFVSFNSLGTNNHENKERYFLKPIAEKYNFSCLGIITKVDNYYLHPEMQQVIEVCNNITKNYKKIIVIGLSMGGYGALKYSKALNADIVFTMSPRCTIDIEQQPLYSKEVEIAATLPPEVVKNSTIKADDVGGKVFLVCDPLSPPDSLDFEHSTHLRQELPRAHFLPTYFTKHMVIFHLQGSVVFKSIIDALATGDKDNIVKTVTYVRRHHINNIIAKTDRFLQKYPYLTHKMLAGPTFDKVKNNHFILDHYQQRLKLCYLLNAKGYQQESSECLKASFLYNLQNIRYDPNQPIIGLTPYPFLINYHGCYIGYDLINKTLETITNILQKPFCLPLQIYKQNGKFKVICIHNGVIFELKYTNSSHFNLALLSNSYTSDHVKLSFHGNYIFIHPIIRKYYITVTLENWVQYDRIAPAEWETFTAVSMVSPSEITTQDYHSTQLDNDNFTISKY